MYLIAKSCANLIYVEDKLRKKLEKRQRYARQQNPTLLQPNYNKMTN